MSLRTPAEHRRARHVHAIVDAVNRRDFGALATRFSPALVINDQPWTQARMREDLEALVSAFPDFQWRIDSCVVEGRLVSVCLYDTGTHVGDYRGVEGTGARMHASEMVLYRFSDGVVAEMRVSAEPMLLRDRIVEHDRRRRRRRG